MSLVTSLSLYGIGFFNQIVRDLSDVIFTMSSISLVFIVSMGLFVILGEFELSSVPKELSVFFQTRLFMFMIVYRLFLSESVGSVVVTPLFCGGDSSLFVDGGSWTFVHILWVLGLV